MVFMESLELQPDWKVLFNITLWEAALHSCLEPEKIVFTCPSVKPYSVGAEVEFHSICQRGQSDDNPSIFLFFEPWFCFCIGSSIQAGKQRGTKLKLELEQNLKLHKTCNNSFAPLSTYFLRIVMQYLRFILMV